MLKCLGDSKSQRASESDYWFKSYANFAKRVDFAYWWSFSGGGSAINGATPSNLYGSCFINAWYFIINHNKSIGSYSPYVSSHHYKYFYIDIM